MVRKSSTTGVDKLRNQLLSDLQKEAQQILDQMTQQFTANLNSTVQDSLATASAGSDTDALDSSISGTFSNGLPQLFTAGLNYIFNRPSTSISSSQTSRSIASDQQFRLSQSQAAAQAMAALARGNKNS